MEIIIASDTHGRSKRLLELEAMYPDASLMIHAGDWQENPLKYDHWIGVLGNMDSMYSEILPFERVVIAGNHRIYVCHGNRWDAANRLKKVAERAKEENCDIAVIGHSHIAGVWHEDGICIINPGSLYRSRDGRLPSYCVLQLTKETVNPQIMYFDSIGSH